MTCKSWIKTSWKEKNTCSQIKIRCKMHKIKIYNIHTLSSTIKVSHKQTRTDSEETGIRFASEWLYVKLHRNSSICSFSFITMHFLSLKNSTWSLHPLLWPCWICALCNQWEMEAFPTVWWCQHSALTCWRWGGWRAVVSPFRLSLLHWKAVCSEI